eukprot:160041-Chlamydomonas_euryale.AAC.4
MHGTGQRGYAEAPRRLVRWGASRMATPFSGTVAAHAPPSPNSRVFLNTAAPHRDRSSDREDRSARLPLYGAARSL